MNLKTLITHSWDALFGEYPAETVESKNEAPSERILHFRDLPSVNNETIKHVSYPPKESPMPILSTDYVLSTQAEMIHEIEVAIPLTEEEKDRYLFPVIRRLAAYVHLLPASQSHHHNGRGGLFFHSLDVSLRSVRMARRRIHDLERNQKRRYNNKGRWYLAICIAGLLHDVGKAITDMTVTAEGGTSTWKPSVEPLIEWAQRNDVQDYYVSWIVNRINKQHESASLSLFQALVPDETREFLEQSHSPRMMNEIYDALTGRIRKGSVIADLVIKSDSFSTNADMNRQTTQGICVGVDSPIATIIVQIMHELIVDDKWKANDASSPLIVSDKGVFIQWRRAYPMIENKVRAMGNQSVPRNSEVMVEKLKESGFVDIMEDNNELGHPYWYVLPVFDFQNIEGDEAPRIDYRTCLKIHNPEALFGEKALPEKTLVLLRGVDLTEADRDTWLSLTGFDAPETQVDLPEEVIQQQDEEALQYLQQVELDEFGEPIVLEDSDQGYADWRFYGEDEGFEPLAEPPEPEKESVDIHQFMPQGVEAKKTEDTKEKARRVLLEELKPRPVKSTSSTPTEKKGKPSQKNTQPLPETVVLDKPERSKPNVDNIESETPYVEDERNDLTETPEFEMDDAVLDTIDESSLLGLDDDASFESPLEDFTEKTETNSNEGALETNDDHQTLLESFAPATITKDLNKKEVKGKTPLRQEPTPKTVKEGESKIMRANYFAPVKDSGKLKEVPEKESVKVVKEGRDLPHKEGQSASKRLPTPQIERDIPVVDKTQREVVNAQDVQEAPVPKKRKASKRTKATKVNPKNRAELQRILSEVKKQMQVGKGCYVKAIFAEDGYLCTSAQPLIEVTGQMGFDKHVISAMLSGFQTFPSLYFDAELDLLKLENTIG